MIHRWTGTISREMLTCVGPLLCLLSALCFGAMAIFGTFAYQAGVSVETLVLVRFVLAAAVLGGWALIRRGITVGRRRPRLAAPSRIQRTSSAGWMVVLIALGLGVAYALQASLFFSALELLDAPLLSLLFYTYPLLVTVGAVLLGRDRLTRARVVGLAAAMAGTALVLGGGGAVHATLLGFGLALGTAVTYTVYILISDTVVQRLAPFTLTALVMVGAALALLVRSVVLGGVSLAFAPVGWIWLGCVALISTVAAALLFIAGLRRTGPSAASILSTFEPVVTTVLAAVALGQLLTPVQIVGGSVIVASVALVNMAVATRSDRRGRSMTALV